MTNLTPYHTYLPLRSVIDIYSFSLFHQFSILLYGIFSIHITSPLLLYDPVYSLQYLRNVFYYFFSIHKLFNCFILCLLPFKMHILNGNIIKMNFLYETNYCFQYNLPSNPVIAYFF